MIRAIDSRPEIGLEIARGSLGSGLARDLEDECRAFIQLRPKRMKDKTKEAERKPFVRAIKPETIQKMGFSTIEFVLKKLDVTEDRKLLVGFQPSDSKQDFHWDGANDMPVVIVYASDDGVFDCNQEGRRTPSLVVYDSIPVNAGDILAQFSSVNYHRGRNPSTHDRYSLMVTSRH